MDNKLSVIIPVYNEANTIIKILEAVTQVHLDNNVEKEVIVVDDHSKDKTFELLEQFKSFQNKIDIKIFRNSRNLGKGASIREGIKHASGNFLIIQDADLEYDPRDYGLLLKPMIEGQADVVYGSRFMGGNAHRVLFYWHSVGNFILTTLSNMLTDLNLTDMETCYKLFRTDILRGIELKEDRFGFEPEVTAKIAKIRGIRIYEVGISYYGRTYAEGKKINWKDGVKAIYCILKYNLF